MVFGGMFNRRKAEGSAGAYKGLTKVRSEGTKKGGRMSEEEIKKKYAAKFGEKEASDAPVEKEKPSGSVREEIYRQREKALERTVEERVTVAVERESLDAVEDLLSKHPLPEYSDLDEAVQDAITVRLRNEALLARPEGMERLRSIFSIPDYKDAGEKFQRSVADAISSSILVGKSENMRNIKDIFSVPNYSDADPFLQQVLMDRVTSSYLLKERPKAVEEVMHVFGFSPPDSVEVPLSGDSGSESVSKVIPVEVGIPEDDAELAGAAD